MIIKIVFHIKLNCEISFISGTQVLVGGGISRDGFDPTLELISLTFQPNQRFLVDPIPASVKDIHVAGISQEQPVVCGKSPKYFLGKTFFVNLELIILSFLFKVDNLALLPIPATA